MKYETDFYEIYVSIKKFKMINNEIEVFISISEKVLYLPKIKKARKMYKMDVNSRIKKYGCGSQWTDEEDCIKEIAECIDPIVHEHFYFHSFHPNYEYFHSLYLRNPHTNMLNVHFNESSSS